ncbi:MAG: bifunctional diaminohydroxyphosphoribosylaminopyrimidine deaminase/5-amino-6-(5-phosphoribosylamino)uracil reductase RibD [Desulfarculales bacterium]|nr:bifunctional diaminohydroxyphosphoribosylaminopyrimidine deaminase/5-amino-6-(5-phosphoribosylamino)uracil reductase RibD [Desulfarculales bacterium]
MSEDKKFMAHTLALSARAQGSASPNPAVGAVVVREGRVVGQGLHRQAGQPHAEVLALTQAGAAARGADLYVNLEPCNHQGRTPACTQAILQAGIKRVVYGAADPNPLAGGGGSFLAAQGLEVQGGMLAERCRHTHRFFLTWITSGRPYVILKSAVSLDGRIADASGHSQWISGEKARREAHRLRSQVDAVMVGAGTVLADNPRLSSRIKNGRNPVRVVVDSRLSTPPQAAMLDEPGRTVIACVIKASKEKAQALVARGAQIMPLPGDEKGRVDLTCLLPTLAREGITSILAEGGGELAFSLARLKFIDELNLFMAPIIIGGKSAPSFVGGDGFATLAEALPFTVPTVRRLGKDLFLSARRKEDEPCSPD